RIQILERELGISKDVLRKWETRYGFPNPIRDGRGERCYPVDQVERLRIVKRLIDGGRRPGAVIGLDLADLRVLAEGDRSCIDAFHESIFEMLRRQDFVALRCELIAARERQGLESFIVDTVAPLTEAVGEAWTLGLLAVYEEHLYSEVIQGLLRESIAGEFRPDGSPRFVVATPPGESHGLGILMLQALLARRGAHCLSLGTEAPMHEVAAAAEAQKADVVGLSFSLAFPTRRIANLLLDLRRRVPSGIEIWAGGRGTHRVARIPHGTLKVEGFSQALDELARLRRTAGGAV
ncbi:MAG: MerR family transcriptional regulator, partial [Rhodocyclaceae bacterium]|nr:MerR family transcriptional regulator [Rhodocyclaceae bacterium]